jgi:mRNA interferase RelE/StbE
VLHGESRSGLRWSFRWVRKAFAKQLGFLLTNLQHPSLHAKKYDVETDLWQARVTRSWRFYFKIVRDEYVIISVKPHPK